MRQCIVPSCFKEEENPLSLFSDLPIERLFRGYNTLGLSVYETDDTVAVEADVPGIQSKDLRVQVEKGILWVKADVVDEKKDPSVKFHMKAARSFSYRIPVPSNVDESKAPEATCKDGVLKICFSKTKIPKPHRIEVKEI